jgi:hypothetical protein
MKFPHKPEKSGSSSWVEAHETADDYRLWRQVRGWLAAFAATLSRQYFYPEKLVCFLCHNSKGKAKCAIILMDFLTHTKSGICDPDSDGAAKPPRCYPAGLAATGSIE